MMRDLPAELGSLEEALVFAREAADEAGLEPGAIAKLELALEEIVVNVSSYAYEPGEAGRMVLRAATGAGEFVVEVEDAGREFLAPSRTPVAKEAASVEDVPTGGLGIFLAGAMVDELTYRREGSHNIVRLVVRLAR